MKTHAMPALLALAGWLVQPGLFAGPDTPARVEVRLTRTADSNPPVGCNEFGDPGGTAYSAGNLIPDSGFEPMSIRRRWRVVSSGVEYGHPWIEVDGGGMTEWDLTTTGYLNDADVRIYRIVDSQGQPLPQDGGGYINLSNAAAYVLVGKAVVPGAGETNLPQGGWVNTVYTIPGPVWGTRANLNFTDARWVENGKTYHYIVTAIGNNNNDTSGINESDLAASFEVSATPQAGLPMTPHIYIASSGDGFNEIGNLSAGGWISFQPRVAGARGNVAWELLDENNQPLMPPAGLTFNTTTGELTGSATNTPPPTRLRFRATATNGVAVRDVILNNPAWTTTGGTTRPEPPSSVTAMAGDGFVYLAWSPSPTPGVVGYRIYRSEVTIGEQRQRIYLNAGAPVPVKDDYVHFSKRILAGDPMWSHPRVRTGTMGETWRADGASGITLKRVPHTGTLPVSFRFPGESCMQAAIPSSGWQEIGGPYIFYPATGGEGEWYGQLEPGRTYRYEAWMRQSGLGDSGRVSMGLGSFYGNIRQSFSVSNTWQLVGFTFTAPPRATNASSHSCPVIQFTGPGILWFDNIRLFRVDTPEDITAPFTPPSPLVFDELMASQPAAGEKGMLRSMGVLLNQATMASALSLHRDAGLIMNWYQSAESAPNMTVPLFLQYALRTGSTPGTRMKPWLNVSSHMREEEWLMLVEYLGAPINPEDPADIVAKPWAYLRYQQRGTATPWTEEFLRIHLEFANETWHNGAVSDEWFGWGRSGWVHSGSQEFGLAARYFTSHVERESPYYTTLATNGKLRIVMGSNYQDYGEKAAAFAPLAHAIAHTTYVGPKWEVGETPLTSYDDHGIQATLLGSVADTEQLFMNYRRQREQLAAAGHVMDLLGYEGGPSGYSLPGQDGPVQHEYSERYGKSLAMGVAALDAWLSAAEYGFSDQAYLGFGIGDYWSSHTSIASGYRPHAGWLAMTLRNRFAAGRMIQSVVTQAPTITWNSTTYPLVSAYAFRDGRRLSLFLLSRKLGGTHDGTDWGDGSTPVTLVLPCNPSGTATLYHLSGNPRASNRDAMNVQIQQTNVVFSRETTVTLHEGSIYLYVMDTDMPDRDDPLPPPASIAVEYSSASTRLSWPAIAGAANYIIYRSLTPYFNRAEVTETFSTSSNSYTDGAAVGGTRYYYRVASGNGWGTGMWTLVASGGSNACPPLLPAPNLHALGASTASLVASWDEVAGATGYRVGISTQSGGPYTWSDAGIALNWKFSGLENGATYYVTVYASSNTVRGPDAPEHNDTPLAGGQTTVLAAWDAAVLIYSGHLENPPLVLPPSQHVQAVTAGNLVRGEGFYLETNNYGFNPGTGDNGGCHYDGKFPFVPISDWGNFGAAEGGSLSNAVERNLYIGCSVTPAPGQSISLSKLETGFQYSFGSYPLQVALRYRVGTGTWHEVLPSGYSITPRYWLYSDLSLELANEPALQNIQQSLELRFYVYWTGNDARWHPAEMVRTSGEDLILYGTTQTTNAPGRPAGLRSLAGGNEVSLSWNPVAGADSYTVCWGTLPGGPYQGMQNGLVQSLATIRGLLAPNAYYFIVQASNSFGLGLSSDEIRVVPLTPFYAWRQSLLGQMTNGLSAASADPDGDGYNNLVEYAMGMDPLQPSTGAPVVITENHSLQAWNLTLPVWTDKTDIIVTVESSTDFSNWNTIACSTAGGPMEPLAEGITVASDGNNPVHVTLSGSSAASNACRFLRVRIEEITSFP